MSGSTTTDQPRSIRGPLRYEVTASSVQLDAGQPFSVFVKITNPYDTATVIQAVATRIPIEFVDVQEGIREAKHNALESQMQRLLKQRLHLTKSSVASIDKKMDKTRDLAASIGKTALALLPLVAGGPVVSMGLSLGSITASTLGGSRDQQLSVEDLLIPEDVDEIVKNATDQGVSADAVYSAAMRRVNERVREAARTQQDEVVLQPGNSVVKLFTLKTTRAILFSPSSYDLHIQIKYQMDGMTNQDSVQYRLNVRAPLAALIYGSLLGSVCGYMIRDIFEQRGLEKIIAQPGAKTLLPWLVALMGNAIVGVVVVIAFARKKDAQPILAIEDFWGGVFVGVLAGYTGKSLFDHLIPRTGAGQP
jgi:hypothetical protein